MLDEQAEQIFAMADDVAERGRKIGGTTLHSIADVAQHKRISDDTSSVSAEGMLSILAADNSQMLANLRRSHELCARHNDFATTSMIEIWIDQTERRVWFLTATLEPDQAHR